MRLEQNNLPTVEAAPLLGLRPNTLKIWARGRMDRGKRIPPRFEEGVHFFKRGQSRNSPLIWRIEACREFLDSQGYVLPRLQHLSSEEGQS